MKIKMFFSCFSLIFLIFPCMGQGQSVHVMAYNIHHGCDSKEKLQLNEMAALIKGSKAEIVGLEEVDSVCKRSGYTDQAKILGELTGMHYAYVRHFAFDGGSYGQALLSKFPISDLQNFRLPILSEGKGDTRALLVAGIQLSPRKQFVVAVAHLDYRSDSSRINQSKIIVDQFKDKNYPVLLIGDLNANPRSETISQLTRIFTDSSPSGSLTFPSDGPTEKIDYILVNKKHFVKTINEPAYKVTYSDHLPISAYIKLSF